MRELHDILTRLQQLDVTKSPAALATVVSTQGSTYRRPGARMLISEHENLGAVSPGCLEDEVIAAAWQAIELNSPRLIQFDTTEEMDAIAGSGLGCRGIIDVFIEPLNEQNLQVYGSISDLLGSDREAVFASVVESENSEYPIGTSWVVDMQSGSSEEHFWTTGLDQLFERKNASIQSYELEAGDVKVYTERVEPRPKLLVFGAGFDAMPLVNLAADLGFAVTIVDHRDQYLSDERFPKAEARINIHPNDADALRELDPHSFIVVMTHNYLYDIELLKYAFQFGAEYIGQIGPKDRAVELLEAMEKSGVTISSESLSVFHAPIGLDLGAETPEEIALSIISEIIAIRNGRSAQSLKDLNAPIHDN